MFKPVVKQQINNNKFRPKIKDLNKYVQGSQMFLIYEKPQTKAVSATNQNRNFRTGKIKICLTI